MWLFGRKAGASGGWIGGRKVKLASGRDGELAVMDAGGGRAVEVDAADGCRV